MCLVVDEFGAKWVQAAEARWIAAGMEKDRTRRRTHHVSQLVADSNRTRHVVHTASDPDFIRAAMRCILLDAGVVLVDSAHGS